MRGMSTRSGTANSPSLTWGVRHRGLGTRLVWERLRTLPKSLLLEVTFHVRTHQQFAWPGHLHPAPPSLPRGSFHGSLFICPSSVIPLQSQPNGEQVHLLDQTSPPTTTMVGHKAPHHLKGKAPERAGKQEKVGWGLDNKPGKKKPLPNKSNGRTNR